MCSAKLICEMTADRFIAVTKPLQAVRHCTQRRDRVGSMVIIGFSTACSIPHYFTSRKLGNSENSRCASFAVDGTLVKVYGFLTSFANSLLPFVALIIMNIKIIRAILTRRKKWHSFGNNLPSSATQPPTSLNVSGIEVHVNAATGANNRGDLAYERRQRNDVEKSEEEKKRRSSFPGSRNKKSNYS